MQLTGTRRTTCAVHCAVAASVNKDSSRTASDASIVSFFMMCVSYAMLANAIQYMQAAAASALRCLCESPVRGIVFYSALRDCMQLVGEHRKFIVFCSVMQNALHRISMSHCANIQTAFIRFA